MLVATQSSFCTHALGVLSQVGRRTTSSCCRLVDQGCKLHPLTLRRVLRRGSEKGVSRRCLERPLVEYAPLGVRPILGGGQKVYVAKVYVLFRSPNLGDQFPGV